MSSKKHVSTLSSPKSIKDYIQSIIEETLASAKSNRVSLDEEEKQKDMSDDLSNLANSEDSGDSEDLPDDLKGDDDSDLPPDLQGDSDSNPEVDSDAEPEQQDIESSNNDKEKMKTGSVEVDDIVDKLNSIRSGKSFKDTIISNSMTEYFNGLDKAEKTALYTFLKSISQIVTGEFKGTDVMEPEDDPSDVKMKKTNIDDGSKEEKKQQKKHIKPNIIRVPEKKEEKPVQGSPSPKKGAEDTSAPMPIKPKKR